MSTAKRRQSQSARRSVANFDYGIKCVVLGDSGVGKTCILQRLLNLKNVMESEYTQEGIFHAKSVKIDDRKIQLSIWDTAGQETFRSVTRIYYRGASCAILVYDITRRPSFNNISVWLKDLIDYSNNPKLVLALVANKSDLTAQRMVSFEEGEKLAKEHRMSYLETSAAKGDNVSQVFHVITQQVYHNIKIGNLIPNSEVNGVKIGNVRPIAPATKEDEKKKACSC